MQRFSKYIFAAVLVLPIFGGYSAAQTVGPNPVGQAPCSAFGTTAGTCAQGNDSRITGAAQQTHASTSWTVTDQSGASLSITSTAASYTVIGNIAFVSFTISYPVTADSSSAIINLPVPVPNSQAARPAGACYSSETAVSSGVLLEPVPNTSTAEFITPLNASVTNVQLTGAVVLCGVWYPLT